MRKSKILALALSAISTGILISCSKPATIENDHSESEMKTASNTDVTTEKQVKIQALDIPSAKAENYLNHVANDYIITAYKESAQTSQKLNQTAEKFCKSGSVTGEELQTLRQEWLTVAKAWSKAEIVNFGTATENMGHLYINYFPDERGLVHRSVTKLITANPNITAEQFIDQSAIVQGIPALEDLLYSNASLNKSQCVYLVSATSELTRRLNVIEQDWRGNTNSLLDTENPTTGLNQWYNSVLSYIETLKSSGVDKPFGLTSHKKGHVPASIAKQSRAIIQTKVTMLNDILTDEKLKEILADKSGVVDEIAAVISKTNDQLTKLPADISEADKADQQVLFDNLTNMTQQIKRQLMPVLGVQIGFNNTDGD